MIRSTAGARDPTRLKGRVGHLVSTWRGLITLAIETSCDDTSVAVLEWATASGNSPSSKPPGYGGRVPARSPAVLHFHEKRTASSNEFKGIHPISALHSHQENLATLTRSALTALRDAQAPLTDGQPVESAKDARGQAKPDFVSVTSGPGMRSSLATGLEFAKGLAVAWEVPLVAVNHMQAHALTPRLVSSLSTASQDEQELEPRFPFLSLLVSGGHTMLIQSSSLTKHRTVASTIDIAVGDFIDKAAREILPAEWLQSATNTMYGALLERYAFPDGVYDYSPPETRAAELAPRESPFGWSLGIPLAKTASRTMQYTFAGLGGQVSKILEQRAEPPCADERQHLAREAMRVAFEHLASRVVLGIQAQKRESGDPDSSEVPKTLVLSGGVASNLFLRTVVRKFLDGRGLSEITVIHPPVELCTDNAAMIAWAGTEMYLSGFRSPLECRPLRKWPLDASEANGGILQARMYYEQAS